MLKQITRNIIKTLTDTFLMMEVSLVYTFESDALSQNFNNYIRLMLSDRTVRKQTDSGTTQAVYAASLRYLIRVSIQAAIEDDYQPFDLIDRVCSTLFNHTWVYPLKEVQLEDRSLGRDENGNYLHEISYSFDIHLDNECLNDAWSGIISDESFTYSKLDLTFNNVLVDE